MIEALAQAITTKLNVSLHKEGMESVKMKLGIEIILANLSKLMIVYAAAIFLHVVLETTIMLFVFAMVRKSAFGIHAKNNIVCTANTLLIFVGGAYACRYILISNLMVAAVFMVITILLNEYAPADTENHPILGQARREQLRENTMTTWIILMTITLFVPSHSIKVLVLMAASFETASVLPITYKIFGRSIKNYEKYE